MATAAIMNTLAVVTNSASPSASIVEAIWAITTTSAGLSPEIVPRYPPARAITKQAAKFPNSTRPTPSEEYGASGPENMKLPNAIWAASSPRPEVKPAESAGTALADTASARSSDARFRSEDPKVTTSRGRSPRRGGDLPFPVRPGIREEGTGRSRHPDQGRTCRKGF